MSRIGKLPIPIPKGVEVKINDKIITVKGPKGTLNRTLGKEIDVTIKDEEIIISIAPGYSEGDEGSLHGLYRALIQNMTTGASNGFEKKLQMVGVGYRAVVQGQQLDLQLGFSHPTKLEIPKEIKIHVDKSTLIVVSGADKQLVGQFAATIRSFRAPEPYKGKGIRYEGEYVRRKAGKAGKTK